MPLDAIIVRGAREHNLKNIDVTIPRDKLVVITGVSGSGKSSLAFETIYAEGQRRYVESLSAYARQFLGQMEKPDVDYIEGLSPAISIDQKGASRNPRSTVGTVTEIYDYLRLLFARAGRPHCPVCGRPITQQTVQQIVDSILAIEPGKRLLILAPVILDRKGEHHGVLEDARRAGFVRVRVDGTVHDLEDKIELDRYKNHTIEVVVDRIVTEDSSVRPEPVEGRDGEDAADASTASSASRLADSVETALKLGGGVIRVVIEDEDERLYSEHLWCPIDEVSFGELAPRNFSFNSPHGACPDCTGLGVKMEIEPELVIPNKNLSIAEGAIVPWTRSAAISGWYFRQLESVARRHQFSLKAPVRELTPEQLNVVLHGDKEPVSVRFEGSGGHHHSWETKFEGVVTNLQRRYKETDSDYMRQEFERYMAAVPCPTCGGTKLKPESRAVKVGDKNITETTKLSIIEAQVWFEFLAGDKTPLNEREQAIAYQVLKEIRSRLDFLVEVGLDYLTIDRGTATLSGGEAQRIRLATQIGSSLMGVLYVCDEPTIGLHPADDDRLIRTLTHLRDLGNTVLIVEHDESMMRAADHLIDMGPGAGIHGGEVVSQGTPAEVMADEKSLTGAYLSGRRQIPAPAKRRRGNGDVVTIKGAREHNLKNVTVEIPLAEFVVVTGVSGSGKSTLVTEILYRKAAQLLYQARDRPGEHDQIIGLNHLDKVINVDQSPIGRTPRSNPATYTGLFTPIRELFASVPEARLRGYQPGRFSFNVKGGRCEACQGEGYIEIEMQFLPDVTVPCEVCKGKRYNREALEILFRGKNIAEVLAMTVEQALEFFTAFPKVRNKLETLRDVGLGYITLGQPATTVSGGEAQRVKLSTELSRRSTGRTLYILDEPTTGLSFEDVKNLLAVLQRLVDGGNTVVVIEHHTDVILNADHVIDLGPNGGYRGGEVVAEGTPEEVAENGRSLTGEHLRRALARRKALALALANSNGDGAAKKAAPKKRAKAASAK
ncbi:MAG TPA: excinuclease ABC subunit UvrA [Dehalococcoidia bacterium]|nr:excinuclease ABC subunit UvrA [Dehalococcoidia bacterium]